MMRGATMTDKSQKMLERVRALIAKADASEFPEEAEAFRAKADDLMTAYAIEAWQVAEAQEGINARPKPERRDFDIRWWFGSPVRDPLWWMFADLAHHCRCVIVVKKARGKSVPVVGLPTDLDYFDMLFTSLMLELANKIDPKYNDRLSLAENIVVFKEAGMKWEIIARLIGRPDFITPNGVKDGGYMVRIYRKYCQENGIKRITVNPQTYQRSFACGFQDGVEEQLRKLRGEQEARGGDSTALVLRDIRDVVQEGVWDLFPDLRPHEEGCVCATCKDKRKPIRYRRDTRKTDYAARAMGERAGREAKIAGHTARRVKNQKELS